MRVARVALWGCLSTLIRSDDRVWMPHDDGLNPAGWRQLSRYGQGDYVSYLKLYPHLVIKEGDYVGDCTDAAVIIWADGTEETLERGANRTY